MKLKLIYILLFLLSKLPLTVLYTIAKILKFTNTHILKYRKNIVNKNIRKTFPILREREEEKLINTFYTHFFNTIVEIIKSINIEQSVLRKRVTIKNIDLLEKYLKRNKPIILIGSHYANWEWIMLRISLIQNIKLSAIYKPIKHKEINEILLRLRTKFGAKLIPLNRWKNFLLKARNKPNTYFFLSDQVPEKNYNSVRCNFLNQSTLFHKGAEKTAKLLNAKTFYIDVQKIYKSSTISKESEGFYMIKFKELDDEKLTIDYVNNLEKTILRKPAHWLWSHNRWKR